MILEEINRIFARINRIVETMKNKGGSGTEWTYTFPEGDTHKYRINNIKATEEIEDNVANVFIWIWNSKDYLKSLAEAKGKNPKEVEEYINSDSALPICGDIANRLKHGKLNKSRSGLYPTLGKLKYTIPKESLESLVFKTKEVNVNILHPEKVTLELPILDDKGSAIKDAFELASVGISSIQKLINSLEKTE